MTMSIPMTPEEEAEALTMLRDGATYDSVTAYIGCTSLQLAKLEAKAFRKTGREYAVMRSHAEKALRAGSTRREVADMLEVSRDTICGIAFRMKKRDAAVRPRR